jgi:predicted Zn-dependent protease
LYLALILNGAPEFDATLSGAPAQVGSLLRAAHLAADAVAVKTMAASGYNPAGLARYVERTAKDDGLPEWQAFEAKRLAELRKGAQ